MPAENILVFDEVSFTDSLCKTFNLVERSEFDKCIRMASGISVIFSANLATGLMAPFVVYKSDSLDPSWTVGGPQVNLINDSVVLG